MLRGSLFCLLAAFSVSAWAHTLPSLLESRAELSTFSTIVSRYPSLIGNLTASGGTILAPTNDAITAFLRSAATDSPSAPTDPSSLSEELVSDLLSYHHIPLELRSEDLSVRGGILARTSLLDQELANLEGTGNVIFASSFGSTGLEEDVGSLSIFSGIGEEAGIVTPDLEIDGGGVVHVVDRVLNFPRTCTQTARTANLSTLLTALETTNLTTVVDTTPKFTCFAPTDEAFLAAGIDLSTLSNDQIADALKYHSIVGDIGYSTAFEDGVEYQTLLGIPVTVRKRDGNLFINDVAVERGNVIMTNGVAHVLSGVLSPPAGAVPSSAGTGTSQPTGGNGGTGTSTSDGSESTDDGSAFSMRRSGSTLLAELVGSVLGAYLVTVL